MKRTILLDGDICVYQAAASNEYEAEWDETLWTLHANFGPAREQLKDAISQLQERLEADDVVVALTDYKQPNWRKAVLPTYKNNRKKTRKPIIYKPLREFVEESYETFVRPGLEADDVLGILATAKNGPVKGERIIATIDKDLQGIEGLHFNFNPSHLDAAVDWTLQVRTITTEQADRFHMTQTLTGDTTDGYSGCPGVGPKGAEKVLAGKNTVEEMWPAVLAAYAKAGLGEEEALRQARVARICRATDYDFKKREVILWEAK